MTIAALFVDPRGAYAGLPDVELWDEARDARKYPGPHPVVAHPPCSRWCQLAYINEKRYGHKVGDDGGCFASALASVRRWGGVLEHPAFTYAWPAFGLPRPPRRGWQRSIDGGWTCQVSQGAYGHRARKAHVALLRRRAWAATDALERAGADCAGVVVREPWQFRAAADQQESRRRNPRPLPRPPALDRRERPAGEGRMKTAD